MQNESQYEKVLGKLYIIGVYGNAEDSPDFLNFFAKQYGFSSIKERVLGLERHKYNQKMKDFLLDEEDVRIKLDGFISSIAV